MVRIGLEPAAAPEQAEVVLTRTYELFECLEKRRDHLSRIRGIDRDAELFARDVGSLVVRIAAELGNQPTGDQARELFRLLREARSTAQTHATLLEQRNRAESKLQDAETRCGAAADFSRTSLSGGRLYRYRSASRGPAAVSRQHSPRDGPRSLYRATAG